MEVSNNYSTAKLWGTSDKKVSKSSEKNKWKLTDSLKEKIVELAKKDAQDNVYMGNAFMNLRKMEVSKVAPNRAALIGKFNQSMNSGNMSAMKEVEKADKKWLCILFGIPYEAEFQGEGTGSAAHVYNECGEEVLTYTEGVGWQEKETKAESQVHSALKSTYYEAFCRKAGRIVLEIDPPETEIAVRRLRFYERLGFVRNDYHYVHPSFQRPYEPHQLVLMSYPKAMTDEECRSFERFVRDPVLRYSCHGKKE